MKSSSAFRRASVTVLAAGSVAAFGSSRYVPVVLLRNTASYCFRFSAVTTERS